MPKRKHSAKTKNTEGADVGSNTMAALAAAAAAAAAAVDDTVAVTNNDDHEEPWSKSKKKRMRRLMAREKKKSAVSQRKDDNGCSNDNENTNGDGDGNIDHRQQSNSNKTQIKSPSESNSIVLNTNENKKTSTKFSALQQKFLSRLAGSRFRELNEELYTTTSTSALERFQQNPSLFEQYHEGFRTQVKSWPVNPVDVIYKWIVSHYHQHWKKGVEEGNSNVKNGGTGSNLSENKKLKIADFGCGDAKLAEKLLQFRPTKKTTKGGKGGNNTNNTNNTKCPFKVHSFDLVSNGNKLITPCDMSDVPLKNSSVDIGVFVLALMGTNIADFIREAHRVLSPNGVLKIAEVRSRFESTIMLEDGYANVNSRGYNTTSASKKKKKKNQKQQQPYVVNKQVDDTLLNDFLDVMEELGFHCVKKDRQNKMFIVLEFKKTGKRPSKDASFTAKPCIYKRR